MSYCQIGLAVSVQVCSNYEGRTKYTYVVGLGYLEGPIPEPEQHPDIAPAIIADPLIREDQVRHMIPVHIRHCNEPGGKSPRVVDLHGLKASVGVAQQDSHTTFSKRAQLTARRAIGDDDIGVSIIIQVRDRNRGGGAPGWIVVNRLKCSIPVAQ